MIAFLVGITVAGAVADEACDMMAELRTREAVEPSKTCHVDYIHGRGEPRSFTNIVTVAKMHKARFSRSFFSAAYTEAPEILCSLRFESFTRISDQAYLINLWKISIRR